MWEIVDNNGVVYSGDEHEMDIAWDVMTSSTRESYIENLCDHNTHPEDKEAYGELYDKYECDNWDGDLKLIQIHKTYR